MALAALAVVLERRTTEFAEEFLLDLAKLKLAEMPLCIRVARECVKHRMTSQTRLSSFYHGTWPNSLAFQQVKPRLAWLAGLVPTIIN